MVYPAINNTGQILVNASASFLHDNGVYGDAIVFPGARKNGCFRDQ